MSYHYCALTQLSIDNLFDHIRYQLIIILSFISGLTFEIAEGGFLDIDVTITGPDGKVIYQGEQEGNGKYTFAAYLPGHYTYCFNNQKSTMTPKVVMFNMEVSEPTKVTDEQAPEGENEAEAADHRKLDEMIIELNAGLRGVKTEQEYMTV